jgi:diacylglycerol kinase (ATP)
MDKKPERKKGIAGIWEAFIYSLNGLKFAIINETAFLQETCIYVVLLIILYFLPLSVTFKCILFFANTIVLLVELLNSAIESIVDMTSPEYHILAKRAKDLGSAAVLISIIIAVVFWLCAIALMLNSGDV